MEVLSGDDDEVKAGRMLKRGKSAGMIILTSVASPEGHETFILDGSGKTFTCTKMSDSS